MPRKSLADQRTSQILDAMEACVARTGLAGTSLEAVAQEAGVKRSILRHYIGNRDDLILAMARRLSDRYLDQLNEMAVYVGESKRIERLIDALFPPKSTADFRDVVLIESLIAASEEDDALRGIVTTLVEETISALRDILRREYPRAETKALWVVAYGVVGIYFNHDSLRPLMLPTRHRSAARSSSQRLIESLGQRGPA